MNNFITKLNFGDFNCEVVAGEISNLIYFNESCYCVPLSFDVSKFFREISENIKIRELKTIKQVVSKELDQLTSVEKLSEIGLITLNIKSYLESAYPNSLNLSELSIKDLNRLEGKLEELGKLAASGDQSALKLLHNCAAHQVGLSQKRVGTINTLINNSFYQEECLSIGSNPLFGLIEEPSYYMTASHNAYFQLARCAAKHDPALALSYYTKAIQLTDFIGKLPQILEVEEHLKEAYEELTRRIPTDIKKKIDFKTHIEPNHSAIVFRQLIRSINALDFEFLWNKEYGALIPYFALNAVKNGMISIEQFSTLMRIWSLKEANVPYSKIEILPAFGNETKKMIESTLWVLKQDIDVWTQDVVINKSSENFLTPHQLETFWKEVKSSLPSDQIILLLNSWDPPNFHVTVSQFISYSAGFNVLARPLPLDLKKRIVPSASLEKAFLKARYIQPVLPNYVLGSSTEEDIRLNGLKLMRDVTLPFPGLPVPKFADNRTAPFEVDFVHHDFFHCYSSSEVGQDGKSFIIAADFIPHEDLKDKVVHTYYESLIDLDFASYRSHVNNKQGWIRENSLPREANFWHELANSAIFAQNNSPRLNLIIQNLSKYLIEEKKMDPRFLKMAIAHTRDSLEKQKYSLSNSDSWMISSHPIFLMETRAVSL